MTLTFPGDFWSLSRSLSNLPGITAYVCSANKWNHLCSQRVALCRPISSEDGSLFLKSLPSGLYRLISQMRIFNFFKKNTKQFFSSLSFSLVPCFSPHNPSEVSESLLIDHLTNCFLLCDGCLVAQGWFDSLEKPVPMWFGRMLFGHR